MANALIVIDVQNDFCHGGALAVPDGDGVVPVINAMMPQWETVILTQDWHPAGHSSFASSHPGKPPFDHIEMPYGQQILWPDHCVQGTHGAEFHKDLNTFADLILRKGFRTDIDSYSVLFENDRTTVTGLDGYLKSREIDNLTLVGLATDFCVFYSAMDAKRLGYDVTVDLAGCRAIDMDGSLRAAQNAMREAGVTLI